MSTFRQKVAVFKAALWDGTTIKNAEDGSDCLSPFEVELLQSMKPGAPGVVEISYEGHTIFVNENTRSIILKDPGDCLVDMPESMFNEQFEPCDKDGLVPAEIPASKEREILIKELENRISKIDEDFLLKFLKSTGGVDLQRLEQTRGQREALNEMKHRLVEEQKAYVKYKTKEK